MELTSQLAQSSSAFLSKTEKNLNSEKIEKLETVPVDEQQKEKEEIVESLPASPPSSPHPHPPPPHVLRPRAKLRHFKLNPTRLSQLNQWKNKAHQVLDASRLILTIIIVLAILFGMLYNFFASNEKDIPNEIFEKLAQFLNSQQPPFAAASRSKIQPLSSSSSSSSAKEQQASNLSPSIESNNETAS